MLALGLLVFVSSLNLYAGAILVSLLVAIRGFRALAQHVTPTRVIVSLAATLVFVLSCYSALLPLVLQHTP